MTTIVGIFVGGASTRMGGWPKGLLLAPREEGAAPRERVVERIARVARAVANDVVLVGAHEAYGSLGMRAIADAREGEGPLGGVVALLEHAAERGARAIAIACDMPYVTRAVLERLATHAPEASAVAPKVDGAWQALFARYDAPRALETARPLLGPADGKGSRGPSALLDALHAEVLPLGDDERRALRDWDAPEDMERG
jgi:molybdopterin-guanine dinucleotide biosynthesis protein A